MDILKKGKSEIDKSERDSERVEDGRASTKAFNEDAEQETGEEVDEAEEVVPLGNQVHLPHGAKGAERVVQQLPGDVLANPGHAQARL